MKNVEWIMDVMDDLAAFTKSAGLVGSYSAIKTASSSIESEIRELAFKSKLDNIRSKRERSNPIRDASHLSIVPTAKS